MRGGVEGAEARRAPGAESLRGRPEGGGSPEGHVGPPSGAWEPQWGPSDGGGGF